MRKFFQKITFFAVFIFSFCIPIIVRAISFRIDNPLTTSQDLLSLIANLSAAVVKIGIPFAVVALTWGGFRFVAATAQGNESKLKDARHFMWWTVIGSAVVVGEAALVYAAVNFAKSLSP